MKGEVRKVDGNGTVAGLGGGVDQSNAMQLCIEACRMLHAVLVDMEYAELLKHLVSVTEHKAPHRASY